jgi:hypothetical protein
MDVILMFLWVEKSLSGFKQDGIEKSLNGREKSEAEYMGGNRYSDWLLV